MPQLEPRVQAAIDLAFDNIHKFHAAQVPAKPLVVEVGVRVCPPLFLSC